MPSCAQLPTIPNFELDDQRPCLLAVHLFSGRRREGDLHWHLQRLAAGLGVRFVVLSMDTAVSPWYGDLWHSSTSWRRLTQCYELGLVALTMVGSPCETFSEARFTPPPPEEGVKWPRPLRSTEWFFGLPDLTTRELRQVHAGTNFFLQGLVALSSHITKGGLFLSEHPGMPKDPDRPSTWRAPLTLLLRKHVDVGLSHINQWQWGADAVKPTGLLAHRLPRLHRSLYTHAAWWMRNDLRLLPSVRLRTVPSVRPTSRSTRRHYRKPSPRLSVTRSTMTSELAELQKPDNGLVYPMVLPFGTGSVKLPKQAHRLGLRRLHFLTISRGRHTGGFFRCESVEFSLI